MSSASGRSRSFSSPTQGAQDLDRLYRAVRDLEAHLGGGRTFADAGGRDGWPARGVYLFLDDAEPAPDGGARVVRVGTHGLGAGSRSTLWGRLSQHQGNLRGGRPGGGNHRGSVFRLHVGAALLAADPDLPRLPSWGVGSSAPSETREIEYAHERRVSDYIRRLRVLWLEADDLPGRDSVRGLLERGAIGVLSASARQVHPASPAWLGHHAQREAIRASGLWNVDHVGEAPPPAFPEMFERHVELMATARRAC